MSLLMPWRPSVPAELVGATACFESALRSAILGEGGRRTTTRAGRGTSPCPQTSPANHPPHPTTHTGPQPPEQPNPRPFTEGDRRPCQPAPREADGFPSDGRLSRPYRVFHSALRSAILGEGGRHTTTRAGRGTSPCPQTSSTNHPPHPTTPTGPQPPKQPDPKAARRRRPAALPQLSNTA